MAGAIAVAKTRADTASEATAAKSWLLAFSKLNIEVFLLMREGLEWGGDQAIAIGSTAPWLAGMIATANTKADTASEATAAKIRLLKPS
ncbi:MAG: hypothetical protein KDD90_04320 [Sphingomonadaceae bacterium]|nr:hypothetical protein [Sphingomonadaceae bacterium]